jgi:hypothetical protein
MIYCIGDSFTYGDELFDPANDAWPALLGKMLNCSVTNMGRNATGNTRIVKRVIDVAYKKDTDIIIIAWTGPNRLEFHDHEPYDIWPGRDTRAIMPTKIIRHIGTDYLTKSHTEKWDTWAHRQWFRDVILTQNLLENQNKKYLMMVAWHNWNPLLEYQDLWDKINFKYFLGHPSISNSPDYETFCYWANGCPRGPGGHPLELGHQRIAEKINEYIRTLGWI